MLQLRKEQIEAVRSQRFQSKLKTLIPEIISRLQQVEVLGDSASADTEVHKVTRADIEMACGYGISSLNGLLQFCSYRYTIGEQWQDFKGIQEILENDLLEEREKMITLEQFLPS